MNGKIIERLTRNGSVCIDSVTFIYFIEENKKYFSVVRDIFCLVDEGKIKAFSSYLTLLEVLVRPLRQQRLDLVNKYKEILSTAKGFTLFPINGEIAEQGARIRALYNFRVPDAIQLATALCQGAGAFVTNDKKLKKFDKIDVVLLKEFIK